MLLGFAIVGWTLCSVAVYGWWRASKRLDETVDELARVQWVADEALRLLERELKEPVA